MKKIVSVKLIGPDGVYPVDGTQAYSLVVPCTSDAASVAAPAGWDNSVVEPFAAAAGWAQGCRMYQEWSLKKTRVTFVPDSSFQDNTTIGPGSGNAPFDINKIDVMNGAVINCFVGPYDLTRAPGPLAVLNQTPGLINNYWGAATYEWADVVKRKKAISRTVHNERIDEWWPTGIYANHESVSFTKAPIDVFEPGTVGSGTVGWRGNVAPNCCTFAILLNQPFEIPTASQNGFAEIGRFYITQVYAFRHPRYYIAPTIVSAYEDLKFMEKQRARQILGRGWTDESTQEEDLPLAEQLRQVEDDQLAEDFGDTMAEDASECGSDSRATPRAHETRGRPSQGAAAADPPRRKPLYKPSSGTKRLALS